MANCEMTRGYFKWDGTRKLSNQQPGTGKTFKDSCILRGPSSKRSQTLERKPIKFPNAQHNQPRKMEMWSWNSIFSAYHPDYRKKMLKRKVQRDVQPRMSQSHPWRRPCLSQCSSLKPQALPWPLQDSAPVWRTKRMSFEGHLDV